MSRDIGTRDFIHMQNLDFFMRRLLAFQKSCGEKKTREIYVKGLKVTGIYRRAKSQKKKSRLLNVAKSLTIFMHDYQSPRA